MYKLISQRTWRLKNDIETSIKLLLIEVSELKIRLFWWICRICKLSELRANIWESWSCSRYSIISRCWSSSSALYVDLSMYSLICSLESYFCNICKVSDLFSSCNDKNDPVTVCWSSNFVAKRFKRCSRLVFKSSFSVYISQFSTCSGKKSWNRGDLALTSSTLNISAS